MKKLLSSHARKEFKSLELRIAETNKADIDNLSFAVQPAVVQRLNEQITVCTDFLNRINVIPVTGKSGETVLIGTYGSVSGRTDTDVTDRKVTDFCRLEGKTYELVSTETDVAITYAKIDSWAKFKDLYERYHGAVRKQIAQDRIVIGFHGTHAAKATDRAKFPWLEDVNKGWLQQLREQTPEQVMTGEIVSGVITIGEGGDFANLDAVVLGVKRLIAPERRAACDLVAIIGSDLLDAESAKLYISQGDTISEKLWFECAQTTATYGGLPGFSIPYFPADAVLVTSWDNLSIYHEEESWRRHIEENPKRSRIEDYNSRNEGYVVEQMEKAALAENIIHKGKSSL